MASETYSMHVREGRYWRQFGFMTLEQAERTIERSTGRIVAVDNDGKVIAASNEEDMHKGI